MAAASIQNIRAARAQFGIGPKRVREKRLRLGQPPKKAEMEYRRALLALSAEVSGALELALFPLLEELEPQFVRKATDGQIVVTDGFAATLAEALAGVRSNLRDQDAIAKEMSERHISTTNAIQRKQFYGRLEKTAGVNLEGIVEEEGLTDLLEASAHNNAALIKSISTEYLEKVEGLVFRNTIVGATAKSLQEEILALGAITARRAKFIARDQTAKLNSAVNKSRQENLGITEFWWRSMRDGVRVRESHRKADKMSQQGRKFRWDTPPAVTGGHLPGEDFGCRCVGEAVIPGLD